MRHIGPNGRSGRKAALTVTAIVALYVPLLAATMGTSAQQNQSPAAADAPSASAFDVASAPSFSQAIKEQLGLELKPSHGSGRRARSRPYRATDAQLAQLTQRQSPSLFLLADGQPLRRRRLIVLLRPHL